MRRWSSGDTESRVCLDRAAVLTRLALAAGALLALAMRSAAPTARDWLRLTDIMPYAAYAAVLAGITTTGRPLLSTRAVHVLDIAACGALFAVSVQHDSLFVASFVCVVLAASLRWRWRGALWTSVAITALFCTIRAYSVLGGSSGSNILGLLLAVSVLTVAVACIGHAVKRDDQGLRVQQTLVSPPDPLGSKTDVICWLTEWAARHVGARRALMAWEEPDEPWLYLAWWDGSGFRHSQEPPGLWESLVPEQLAHANYLCGDVRSAVPTVLYRAPDGLKRWHGAPIHPTLQEQCAPQSILSVGLTTDSFRGRLFFIDKHGPTLEDLTIAEAAGRHIVARLAKLPFVQPCTDGRVQQERLRLARDLHDGVLHSLAGLSLELDALLRAGEPERTTTRQRVADMQQSLLEEQRNIRQLIGQLRNDTSTGAPTHAHLADRLEELARRLTRQRGLRVECVLHGLGSLPPSSSNEIYLIVHEALINAARHANASRARFEVTVRDGHVSIVVADNGKGLAFSRQDEGPAIADFGLGPATIRERVGRLGGSLAIESPGFGTRLTITLLAEQAVAA